MGKPSRPASLGRGTDIQHIQRTYPPATWTLVAVKQPPELATWMLAAVWCCLATKRRYVPSETALGRDGPFGAALTAGDRGGGGITTVSRCVTSSPNVMAIC